MQLKTGTFFSDLPWAMSFCPLPFRFAPVTVGSGRKADCKRIYPFKA